ncbi:MAG: hypothetical protein IJF80_00865 [Clostridia bacterium]|nr:hypothetical protein [Clostridia bacterium]
MIYTRDYEVAFEDCENSMKMSLKGILRAIENVASLHSDRANDNVIDSSVNNGITWVIVEWNMKLLRVPDYCEKVTVSTWSYMADNTRSVKRGALICDRDGKHLVEVLIKFMLIDRKTGLPLRITEDIIEKYKPEDKSVYDETTLGIVHEPKEFEREVILPLRRSDIDFNEHVHNLNYLDFALEALPEDVYKKNNYSNMRIIYRRAMKLSDVAAVCKYSRDDKKHTVCMYSKESGALMCIVVLNER